MRLPSLLGSALACGAPSGMHSEHLRPYSLLLQVDEPTVLDTPPL